MSYFLRFCFVAFHRSLRQFAVASTMNKAVVSNSTVLRPRLLHLLERFQRWSHQESKVCVDVCGLINSLVRDCVTLSEHILSRPSVLNQLVQVIFNVKTENRLRELTLLLLRSLFGAEELNSVLCSPPPIQSQKSAALNLFNDATLRQLLTFFRSTSCLPSSGLAQVPSPVSSALSTCGLTNGARCWLMELLALLATDPSVAVRLVRLGVIEAARFALKLLAHLLFHVDDALDVFKKVYQETDPIKLVACYGHLTGAVPPAIPRVCHEFPPGYRSKWTKSSGYQNPASESKSMYAPSVKDPMWSTEFPNSSHRSVPVCSCAPSAHGTQAFLGIVRGLLYWRLVTQKSNQSVKAVDQFGNHVTSATGLGMNADDVALLILQPLTEGCLHVDDTRIFSWICHVLVLVLDQRTELHLWTVYTNSFIREMDNRVTALITAVQAALDGVGKTLYPTLYG
ncbi:hypothetical protein FBUS_08934 [Fasciolopsis buskii]|uniref:Uncharacterized protein n=1 Tax=Fasciolopsis buskii TaxID=27845 RepID=A0A8E0S7D2_9TREM|nr:hypothetical protein FBUS_08934 [Fasciolopsis buski]